MKTTIISITSVVLALVIIMGANFLSSRSQSISVNKEPTKNNVTVDSGTQIVEITAKGGYDPRKSIAKAGLPTTLRVDTSGTFDCSSTIRIPSLNISKNLPQSGVTDIDLGTQLAGVVHGTCGMGMYPFEIDFQ